MTTQETPALTDRNLPAPWVACEVCSSTVPALPDLDGSPRCPNCAQNARLTTAAYDHLAQLLAPVLGAWGNHYAAQGMTRAQLFTALDIWAGLGLSDRAQGEQLAALLTDAMQEHTPPVFTPAPPDRVQLDARTVPQVLSFTLDHAQPQADGAGRIDRRLSFTVREADGRLTERLHLAPGCDVLLILNTTPQGDALLIYTGIHGQTDPARNEALRVPADLLPQVRAALGYTFTAGGAQ